MSWETALWIYAGLLGVLLLSGVPIGAALGLTGLTGVTMVGGTRLWPTLGSILWNNTQSFTLVAIPLFVFMGEIILRTGVSKRNEAAAARRDADRARSVAGGKTSQGGIPGNRNRHHGGKRQASCG